MTEPTPDKSSAPASDAPPAGSPGRAFLVYSLLRLAILAVSYAVLLAIGLHGPLAIGIAVLLSALLSLLLLRDRRDAFTQASMARAAQRRELRSHRRARLDETPVDGQAPPEGRADG